ncbi:hypothetical protein [Naasia lichenicola]|nr:hypothetical protein [Naasia lichenicola]
MVKGEVIIGTPKTHKRRFVPFPAFLVPALAAALAGREGEDFVSPV